MGSMNLDHGQLVKWPDVGRPVKPHRSGGGLVARTDFNKCPYCDSRRPHLSGPSDPRPWVCLEHRDLRNMKGGV